jgi:hypothetical protein
MKWGPLASPGDRIGSHITLRADRAMTFRICALKLLNGRCALFDERVRRTIEQELKFPS